MEKSIFTSLVLALVFHCGRSANVPFHIKDGSTAIKGIGGATPATVVAFSAVAHDHMDAVSGDMMAVFKNVVINEGNGYNPVTGIFQAPVRGIYFFQVFCLAEMNRAAGFDLYHNTKAITYFTYGAVPGGMGVGGNSIILQLEKFDNVFLKLKKGHAVHNHANEHHNTFTGYLISELPSATEPTGNAINIHVG